MSDVHSSTNLLLVQEAFEHLPLGVVIVDGEGTIVAVNRQLEELLGYSRSDLVGHSVEQLVPEPAASAHRAQRAKYGAQATLRQMGAGRELHARHRDGRLIPVEIGLSPMRVGEAEFVLSTIVDITERRELEMQLLQTQKVETIGNLASGVAHDFNNILLGILGSVEMLKLEAGLTPEINSNLDVVIESAQRGRDLIERILAFVRKDEIKRAAIQWEPVIRGTLKLMRASIPSNVRVELQVQDNVASVWASAVELQQIFMNVLGNAAHACAASGGAIRVQLATVEAPLASRSASAGTGGHGCVRLRVTDEGVGMPPSVVRRVFEPFFTTKPRGEGTGLGMSVVQRVVQRLGGKLGVVSREGEGTQIDIDLPAVAREADDEADKAVSEVFNAAS